MSSAAPAQGRAVRALLLLLAGILMNGAVMAADQKTGEISVSGQASLVSDYIWRGLSQTWGKPAVQLSFTADHRSGAYAGFFASNVSSQFVPNGTIELDFSAGYKTSVHGVDLDLGGVYAYYPGADFSKTPFTPSFDKSAPHALELYAGATLSSVSLRVGYIPTKFYGWNVNNSGTNGVFNSEQPQAGLTGDGKGSINGEASYTFNPRDSWSLQATLGRQYIPDSHDVNWTYGRLGLTVNLDGGWTAGIAGSATTKPKAFANYGSLTNNGQRSTPSRNTVVLSLTKAL